MTEGEKEVYDSEMTGEKLKEEIEAFGIDNNIENSLDIGFQQAVLTKFIMLKRHGEQLRKVQKNLNVDSQGLGKSTFDTIDRMQRIEELVKNNHVANSEALIGEYKSTLNVSEKKAQELIDDGFIRLDEFFIRPTTISGIISVNTISAANNLWSNYLPYNSEVMKNVFKEIMELRSIGVDAEVEAKQQVLQEMKKYLNSMDMGLYTLQPDQERERLFIDSENNNSLATYLNEITKITGDKAIDIYINKNRLIERLEYQSNKNTDVSLIKFNNSVGENFDEDAMYNALLVLMDKEIELPPHNGKPYNTRMLAQDLMNYALLEGGVQEAVQFSKFIPIEFLNKTRYSKSMENINLGNVFNNVFGTQSNSAKEVTPYAVSNFTRQYAQHYPNLMPKTNDKNKDMGNIKRKEEKLPNGTTIKYIESFTMGKKGLAGKPFLAIYNSSDKRKGKKKKFDLYEFNGVEYVRIPTLGTFGMSEYDANTTKVKGSVIGVNTSSNKPVNQVVSKTQQKKEPAPEKNIPHKIGDGNIYDTIESIANEDYPGLSAMAKALLPFVDTTVKLTAMPFKNNVEAYGAYARNHHTIGMNVLTMSSRNPEDTARTLLHEYVHSITVKELQKWVEFDANDQIVSLKEGAPKPIENLVRLFNDTKNHFESILSEDGKTSQLDMLKLKMSTKPKQPLTAHEHDVVYGAYNIFEFLTLSTTSPKFQQYMANTEVKQSGKTVMEKFREIMKDLLTNMGVVFEPPNIATSAIAETFKLLEIVKTEKDSKFTIDESTDKNSKLLEKVDNALPKKQPKNTMKVFKNLKGKDKTGLQERITKKLPLIANPNAKKHVPKELVKTKIATQYIGDGSPNSSTDRYKKMYAEEGVANTGAYTSSDVIYVSSNGKRGGRVNPVKDGVLQGEYINVQKAMDAGATIVMDTAAHLKKTAGYNIGELALAKYLKDNGYKREGVSGIWKPVVQPTTQSQVKEDYAKTKGFTDWKHVLNSINKRARERGKPERKVTKEEFDKLTTDQIDAFAKASETAKVPTKSEITGISINNKKWTKDSPKENPNTAYVFTENINSIGDTRVGGGSAVIRNNPNAIGIVTKKYYTYKENRTSKNKKQWNANFQDTYADFELFKKTNLEQFAKLDEFDSKIFPDGFANSLAVIPNKFALWLQNELQTRYGLVTELNSNGTGLISKSVQPTTQPVIPTEPTPTKITYTPTGKKEQTYIIKGNKIFNSKGKEVFSKDSRDRNKIFANLAVKQGRAKVVIWKNTKYIVNDKNVIISGVTGKIMKWGENDGNRKAILKLVKPEVTQQVEESKPAKKLKFGKKGPSGFDFSKVDDADVVNIKKKKDFDFGDGDVIFDPAKMTREQELEQKFKLRHPTGRRKTYLKKNYKSTLAKTIKLNKANTDSTFKFKMIEVMGEKGDRRTYNAIAVVPVTSVAINPDKNFSSKQVKKIDKLIENFEKTCK